MADKFTEAAQKFLASLGVSQGTTKVPSNIIGPNDPDFIAALNQYGVGYTYYGPGQIRLDSAAVQKLYNQIYPGLNDNANPTDPNAPPGGATSGGGGAGGGVGLGDQYQHLADLYNYGKLTGAQIGALTREQISPTEFQWKLQVWKSLKDNQEFFDQYEATLKWYGLAKKFGTQERLSFIIGESQGNFVDIWNEAAGRTSLAQAGFEFGSGKGGDLNINRKDLLSVMGEAGLTGPEAIGQVASRLDPAAQSAAQYIVKVGAWARAQSAGLQEKDVLRYALGIGSAKNTEKLNRLVAEDDAFAQFQSRAGALTGLSGQPQ